MIYSVVVNFMCQLDWPKGCPDAGRTVFLDVSVRVCLGETAIWFRRPSPMWVVSSNPLRAQMEHRGWGGANSLSPWAGTSVFSCLWPQSSRFSGLRSRLGSTIGFSHSPACRQETVGVLSPPQPYEPIPTISPISYLPIYLYPISSVALEHPA